MDLFKYLFLVLIFSFVSTAPHSDHHDDEDPFHGILETLKLNDTLRLQDVNAILTKLGLKDCSNATKHKCITAESLFKIFNISNTSSVNEDEFSNFAPIIIYALLPNEKHSEEHTEDDDHDKHDDHDHDDHDHDHNHDEHDDENDDHDDENDDHDNEITQNVDVHKQFLIRYETGTLCAQIFDQLLKEINSTIGHHAGNKCFSSDDIFHQLNISSDANIKESLLPEISVTIISRLVQEQCIKAKYQSALPCSSYFVNQLFEKYAINGAIGEEEMEKLLKKLKIGRNEEHEEHDDHDDHGDHSDHDHRRRRRRSLNIHEGSQIQGMSHHLQKRYRRQTTDHNAHGNETKMYQKCYSVDELFAIYQVDKMTGFALEKFQSLSSALLQQIESETCAAAPHSSHKDDDVAAKHKWGYGVLAVAIISMLSLVGVAIIPIMNRAFYKKTLMFFIALAIGTLVGDALLHLFPHALGFHASHDHAHGSGSSHEEEDRDHLWKFLVAIGAIYGFFLFETISRLLLGTSGHTHFIEHNATEESAVTTSDQSIKEPCALTNMAYLNTEGSENQSYPNATTTKMNQEKPVAIENGYDGISSDKSSAFKKKEEKKISSVAWNILIGDTLHNVADGIAIGIAFSDSISGGISTTIAVFCHELPHELGDFAVLLSAGMSVKKALLANFLTALSCFIGLVFGILISEIQDANLWIFAITGGFFIYIALTNMLPMLMHSPEFRDLSNCSKFILQNLAMLIGFGIMLLLSYYEEDINV